MASGTRESLDLTLISRRYPPQIGGAEKVMGNFSQAFADLGYRVTVLSSAEPAEGIRATDAPMPANESLNPVVIRLPYNGIRFLGTALYMRSLRRWLVGHRSELVYVSMLKHDAYVATRCCRSAGIPVVLRPEGAGATGDMAWQRHDRFGGRIRTVTRTADAFVALSERIRDELIESGYEPTRIFVIPNGVPIPDSTWRPSDSSKAPTAVFVGRLAPEKGIDRLLKAWQLVIQDCPRAKLCLIGDGSESNDLKSLAKSLGIAEFVEFAGARPDVQEILIRSDIFVLPSREEGLSIALLEAMSSGIPVVVSDIPGNRMLVNPEKTGQIVDAENPAALARALVTGFGRPSRILAMAEAGRELVSRCFSVRTAATRHDELFRSLIDRKQRR